MHDLHRSLVDYDMAMLRAVADSRGITLETNVQTEAVDSLAQALLDPLSLRTVVARLSPDARDALGVLLAAGGRQRAPRFLRRFGEIRHVGPGRLAREAPWRAPANSTEELWYAGLIFRAFGEETSGAVEFVYVPDDVRSLLPRPAVAETRFHVDVVTPVGDPATGQDSLVEDVFHYLVLVQTRDVRLDAAGHLSPRDQAQLGERVPWAAEGRLELARHLAAHLGLVARDPERGLLGLEAGPARRWLAAEAGEQLTVLQRGWRDDPTWNDLCHVPTIDCDTEAAWYQRYDPVGVRYALFAFLARCPTQEWWSLESLVAAIKDTDPDFQRPDGDYTDWHVRDAQSGDYLSGFESWDRVEGALIADLCTGVFAWLGLLSVAHGSLSGSEGAGGGAACKVTPAGLAFLRESLDSQQAADVEPPPGEVPPSPPVVVRPDFAVEVRLPASLYTRFQLERFADPHGSLPRPAASPKNEMVYRYHLNAGSLGRGLARGIRADQVLAFLRQVTAGRVPANVAGKIQAWAERHGQVAIQEVALLHAKSERALRELMALPETRALIDRQLSPTTALVRHEHLPQLRRVLRELGFLTPEA
jgi:hypothetical protein